MRFINTPSQRVKTWLEKPEIRKENSLVEHASLITLKNIFGSPIPYLLIIYTVSLLLNESLSEYLRWIISFLTIVYIVIDKFCINKEITLFKIGGDVWIWILCTVAVVSLLVSVFENVHTTRDFIEIMGITDWLNYEFFRYIIKGVGWIIPIYFFTYALSLFPGINRLVNTLIVTATIISIYSIIQHFTGIDFNNYLGMTHRKVYQLNNEYQVIGFLEHHLKYAYCFAMVLCFVVARLMTGNFKNYKGAILLGLSSILMALSVMWTYSRGAWIAVVAAVITMSFFVSKRIFYLVTVVTILTCTSIYFASSDIKARVNSIVDMEYSSNSERLILWNDQMKAFYENPILGVGLWQNRKVGRITAHAHNMYIEWMASVGVIGIVSYLLFILTFMLISYDLLVDIPRGNVNHRSFVLGAMGAQVVLHVGGLTNVTFIDAHIGKLFIFILCILAYINHNYKASIIQGDNQL